ncbi:MAG TPA: hypothetical protein VFB27_11340 [Opitutaceae bacterium]|nr:hypothetical protein [Opitutaceae bacterium]
MNPASVSPETSGAPKVGGTNEPLHRYFRSGWAFLIPYLFFYLLYYWRKWPANPLAGHTLGEGGLIPALLHVYWALHVINLLLAAFALYTFWQKQNRPAAHTGIDLLYVTVPWALLALVFFIPGAYLEFPSDPWEHFRRINEWSAVTAVSDHSAWFKSGYFFAYSLMGRTPVNQQFFWLNLYYTGVCLLLAWQCFRLALATGLGKGSAFVFVLLQALLFGNSSFSFYRYYGISTTIFSQLGAMALIRIGLDCVRAKPAAAGIPAGTDRSPPGLRRSLASALCLLPFIVFNHLQGIGLAALGLAALAMWRLIVWKRSMIWWLAAIALILNLAVMHLWPHHRSLDRMCRAQGWFSAWDGFDLFAAQSPARFRALQILGCFGVVNLAAGLWLLCCNRVVGWLTVLPVLVLCLPCVAIPLAGWLTRRTLDDIVIFHRLLLAIPTGLAVVCLGRDLLHRCLRPAAFSFWSFLSVVLALLFLTTISASGPYYNRTWQALVKTPKDLTLLAPDADFHRYSTLNLIPHQAVFAASSGLTFVLKAQEPAALGYILADHRLYLNEGRAPALDFEILRATLAEHRPSGDLVVMVPRPTLVYSAYSFAALCSGHWLPQEVALAFSGGKELRALGLELGLHLTESTGEITYLSK